MRSGDQQHIDRFTLGYIRKRARQLAGKHGFRKCDREEIEQQLLLKLAGSLHQADADEPKWKAFVAKTVSRQIASMIRDAEAKKRDHRRTRSIHDVVGSDEEGPVELAATIDEREGRTHLGVWPRSQQELQELAMDVASCIADVDDERQREFCERLQYDSVAQVARDMDIPPSTLKGWLRKLMHQFEEKGLKNYLELRRRFAPQPGC